MNHPYSGGDKSSTSIDPTTKPKRGKKKSKPGSIETIDQFQTQTQEESSGRSKRKYLDMAIESEEDEDYSIQPVNRCVGYSGIGRKDTYAVRSAGYSWKDYRKTHGEGTVGGSDSDDAKAASRALEDIKSFAVSIPFHLGPHVIRDICGIRLIVQERPPDSWLPLKKWDVVSPECESRTFLSHVQLINRPSVHQSTTPDESTPKNDHPASQRARMVQIVNRRLGITI